MSYVTYCILCRRRSPLSPQLASSLSFDAHVIVLQTSTRNYRWLVCENQHIGMQRHCRVAHSDNAGLLTHPVGGVRLAMWTEAGTPGSSTDGQEGTTAANILFEGTAWMTTSSATRSGQAHAAAGHAHEYAQVHQVPLCKDAIGCETRWARTRLSFSSVNVLDG